MKRIVICCDGTWKRVDQQRPTNVLRLAKAVLPQDAAGVPQVVYHLDGVGTGRGTGGIARMVDRVMGGLFGQGLMTTLEAAYRFLVFNHAPGDEIYLFGFSRGAFTARSLAGLIRNCGIVSREHAAAIPAALALYRARDRHTHPDAEASRWFRAVHAPQTCATAQDASWRRAVLGRQTPVLRVRYLGVWDTVGALGVPQHVRMAGYLNRRLQFHDAALSRGVAAARHAVAIDERRRTFAPALWDNLDALNRDALPSALGQAQPYAQRWFPGDHASVGGGGAVTLLSSDALGWVADGAAEAGLALDARARAAWTRERDWRGPLNAGAAPRRGLLGALLALDGAARQGPLRPGDLAPAARRRWRHDPRYRPAALAHLQDALEAEQPAADAA